MKLSIITPTYNRGKFLPICFESLLSQTNKNFEWVIIDDGSKDETKEVVDTFKEKANFELIYKQKENGGKHTALNFAYQFASGEITLILDSDDYLSSDAVESILTDFAKYYQDDKICGLSYLRSLKSGDIIGQKFPKDIFISSYIECRVNKNVSGDKAEVFRTKLLKENHFPVFEGEIFLGESIIWSKLGYEFQTVHINKAIYICEYLENGLSKSGRKLRTSCPLGGMEYAKIHIDKRIRLKVRVKMILLYICYSKFAKIKFKEAKSKIKGFDFSFFILRPFGYLLYKLWKK